MLTKYQNIINGRPIHIATVTADKAPNLAVASDVKVLDDTHLLISVNEMVHTQKNILRNPKIAATAFDKNWSGVRIFGKAEFYTNGEYFDICHKTFFGKNEITSGGATKPKGTIIISVEKIEEYA